MRADSAVIIPARPAPQAHRLAFSLAEASASTGLSRRTLERLIAAGQLRAAKVGARTIIRAAALV